MKHNITLLLFILLGHLAFAQISTSHIEWQTGLYGHNVGAAGIIPVDLDGDHKNELILSGESNASGFRPNTYFYILSYDSEQRRYVIKWMSRMYFSQIKAITVNNFDKLGNTEIFVGFKDGTVKIFDGINLNEISSFRVPSKNESKLFCIEFGDANNDGTTDLLASDGQETFMYNSLNQLIGKIPHGALKLKIGNIDEDARNEIIFSTGKVVETFNSSVVLEQTFITDSRNVIYNVALSDINQDQVADLIYSQKDSLFAFDARHRKRIWATKWEDKNGFNEDITTFLLFDYNNDKVEDIFLGNSSWTIPYCYNGKTGVQEFYIDHSMYNPMYKGVTNIAISDLDTDGSPELVYTSGLNSTGPDYIHVFDLATKQEKWQSTHLDGPFYGFDYGDVDNDNKMEIVISSYNGFIQVYDAETYHLEWQSPILNTIAFNISEITMIKIKDIDGDGKNELLVAGGSSYTNSFLYSLDANYQAKQLLSIEGMDQILDLQIDDVDSDGLKEIVVTTGTYVSGSTYPQYYSNKIHVFDAKTKQLKWQSKQLGGIGTRMVSLKVGNIDQDETKEIVAIMKRDVFSNKSKLVVLDGKAQTTWADSTLKYTALDLVDWNRDGQHEIVAATDSGKVIFLNGTSLKIDSILTTNSKRISALQAYDVNEDGIKELVYADYYTLNLFDMKRKQVYWKSDTINASIGNDNRLMVGNFDNDPSPEVLLDGNHAFIKFQLDTNIPVLKSNQTILFETIETQTSPSSFTLSATATSSLPVIFKLTSVPVGIANLEGKVVTLLEAGQVTVTASQPGNDKYNPAQEVVRTFRVEKALGTKEDLASSINIYPIPASEDMFIELPSILSESNLTILNYQGKSVKQTQTKGDTIIRINIQSLQTGLYIIKIQNNKYNLTKKILIVNK
jgi:hypothetical protein